MVTSVLVCGGATGRSGRFSSLDADIVISLALTRQNGRPFQTVRGKIDSASVGSEEPIATNPLKCSMFLPIFGVLVKEVTYRDQVALADLAATGAYDE
jgi:hypothetical protein